MAIAYEQVVPWGRSYDEYVKMFALSPADLIGRVLGCGDGPAAFNAEATTRGGRIVSVDPIYAFTREQIAQRIDETYAVVIEQTRANRELFLWTAIPSVEALGDLRMRAMRDFLSDYEKGREHGRYIAAELPKLPFAEGSFDLVLSSHFLFLYSDNLDLGFHRAAISEMLRVGREVRIFPVLDVNARPSRHLAAVMAEWPRSELVTVDYEFQIGGNQMLVVRQA